MGYRDVRAKTIAEHCALWAKGADMWSFDSDSISASRKSGANIGANVGPEHNVDILVMQSYNALIAIRISLGLASEGYNRISDRVWFLIASKDSTSTTNRHIAICKQEALKFAASRNWARVSIHETPWSKGVDGGIPLENGRLTAYTIKNLIQQSRKRMTADDVDPDESLYELASLINLAYGEDGTGYLR